MRFAKAITTLFFIFGLTSGVSAHVLELPLKGGFAEHVHGFNSQMGKPINVNDQGIMTVNNDEISVAADNAGDWQNYSYEVDMKPLGFEKLSDLGTDFLYANQDNYYRISFLPAKKQLQLLKKENDKTSLLKTKGFALESGRNYHLKASIASGGEIAFWIDGTRVIWEDQANNYKADLKGHQGSPRFYALLANVEFANFKAYPVDPAFLYDIRTAAVDATAAEISWKINYNALSEVAYDLVSHKDDTNAANYKFKAGNPQETKDQKIKLSGLKSGATYYFRVQASGESTTITDELSFTMPEVAGVSTARKEDGANAIASAGLKVASLFLSLVGLLLFLRAQKKDLSLDAVKAEIKREDRSQRKTFTAMNFEIPKMSEKTEDPKKNFRNIDTIQRN